jgi:hypothetical protein
MATTIKIEGGRMNPVKRTLLSLIWGGCYDIHLETKYDNVTYEFGFFVGLSGTNMPLSLDLIFFRKKGRDIPNTLNNFVLQTDGKGNYKLEALEHAGKPYKIEGELLPELTTQADEAIRRFAEPFTSKAQ